MLGSTNAWDTGIQFTKDNVSDELPLTKSDGLNKGRVKAFLKLNRAIAGCAV